MIPRRIPALILASTLALPLPATAQLPRLAPMVTGECVVLLHGLGRSGASLTVMEEMLAAAGYRVVNIGYPSTDATVEDLLGHVGAAVGQCEDDRVNFVTHSMGGILIRAWLAAERAGEPRAGRDARAARTTGPRWSTPSATLPFFAHLTGPAGQELGTAPTASPRGSARSTSTSASSPATAR